jgi:hypothetical protein
MRPSLPERKEKLKSTLVVRRRNITTRGENITKTVISENPKRQQRRKKRMTDSSMLRRRRREKADVEVVAVVEEAEVVSTEPKEKVARPGLVVVITNQEKRDLREKPQQFLINRFLLLLRIRSRLTPVHRPSFKGGGTLTFSPEPERN